MAKPLCSSAKVARKIIKNCNLAHLFTDTAGLIRLCRAQLHSSWTRGNTPLQFAFPPPPFSYAIYTAPDEDAEYKAAVQ